MKRSTIVQLLIGAAAIATLTACGSSSTNDSNHSSSNSNTPPVSSVNCNPTIAQIADNILTNVGKRTQVGGNNCTRKLIVLEERHDSRIGQIELAIMLYRLYRDYGLRHLALEGAVVEKNAPDATWFHKYPNEALRRDVAMQLLKQGEISAADFMAMVFKDFQLHPIEHQQEYQVGLPDRSGDAPVAYLLAIAEKSLSPEHLQKADLLMEQENGKEAFNFILDSDPWVKEHYNLLINSSISIQEIISLIDKISEKAKAVGADTDKYESSLQEYRTFFVTASQRSHTMTEKTLALLNNNPGVPIAINTGAAHTDELKTLLKQQPVSFAVVAPASLAKGQKMGD